MIPAKNRQYYQFCAYGFFKNLRFFDPFLLLFFVSKGFSYFEVGQLYAIREIGFFITEIPSGIFADAYGRRRSLIFSFAAYLLSFLAFYFAQSLILLAGAMVLFSLGEAFRSGTHKALIFTYLEQNGWLKYKTDYYGSTRSCSQFGSAVSAALAALIVISGAELKAVFLFSLIPYFLDLVNISLYPASLDQQTNRKSTTKLIAYSLKLIKESWLVLRQKTMLKAVFNLSVFSAYYKSTKDYLQALILGFSSGIILISSFNNKQQNALFIGIVYTLLFLLTSVASRKSSKFQSLFKGEKRALNYSLFIGLFLSGTAGLFLLLDLKLIAILLFSGTFIIENIRRPIGISHVVGFSNQNINATVLSASSQIQALLAALLSLIFGLLADYFSLGTALIASTVFLLALIFIFRITK